MGVNEAAWSQELRAVDGNPTRGRIDRRSRLVVDRNPVNGEAACKSDSWVGTRQADPTAPGRERGFSFAYKKRNGKECSVASADLASIIHDRLSRDPWRMGMANLRNT